MAGTVRLCLNNTVMYPEQNQNPYQPPADYLDQIAPQAPQKHGGSSRRLIGLIIIGVISLIILVVIIAVIGGLAANKTKPLHTLAARLHAMETITNNAQQPIKNSRLRGLNSNLNIILTNANRDIATPLAAQGINVKKLDSSIIAAEANTTLIDKLEDARLNADFDRTYAREMAYYLSTTFLLIQQIYQDTNKTDLRTFLDTTYSSLEPIEKEFDSFNAANG